SADRSICTVLQSEILFLMKTTERMDELVAQVNHEEPPPKSRGWVEVIAGSMFSGKSEELIRRLRRAKIARQKVQVFKPELDSRFAENEIVSHSEMRH